MFEHHSTQIADVSENGQYTDVRHTLHRINATSGLIFCKYRTSSGTLLEISWTI